MIRAKEGGGGVKEEQIKIQVSLTQDAIFTTFKTSF